MQKIELTTSVKHNELCIIDLQTNKSLSIVFYRHSNHAVIPEMMKTLQKSKKNREIRNVRLDL